MKRKYLIKFFKNGMDLSLFATLGAIMVFLAMYLYAGPQLPAVETLKDVRLQTPMNVYTKDQQLLAQFGSIKRIPVSYEDIPNQLNQALIATEDRRFFFHGGVDAVGFARAVFLLVSTGRMDGGGGSTITMQLARNFFLTFDQTFTRKTKEIFLAWKIERALTKKEILTLYWNKIDFSNRAHGVGAAAQVYYGTTVDNLTLPQLAIIAGIPKGPTTHNPLANPEKALNRRNHVLRRMYVEGYIDQQTLEESVNTPLTAIYHGSRVTVRAPYLAEMVRKNMINRFGKNAYTSGYKVFTTLNSKLQHVSRRVLRQSLVDYDRRHGFRGVERHFDEAEQLLLSFNMENNTLINGTETKNNLQEVSSETDPWTDFDFQPLDSLLSDIPVLGDLIPALVLSVSEKSVQILLRKANRRTPIDSRLVTINWPGLSWARPFISENRSGNKPRTVSEILKSGDLIRTYQDHQGNWQLTQLPEVNAGFVAIKPKDGAIISLVGGFDNDYNKFNNVVQARRQPGSNIKPFIYSAALEKGYTAATVVNDAPFTKVDDSNENIWRPKNSSGKYKGPTRLRKALTSSTNTVSIRLLNEIGPMYAIDHLSKMGFNRSMMPAVNSLALGAANFTPLEVAGGFAVFANGGYQITPYFISRIEDSNGNIIFEEEPLTVCHECETILENESVHTTDDRGSYNPLLERANELHQNLKNAEATLIAEMEKEQNATDQETETINRNYPGTPDKINEQLPESVAEDLQQLVMRENKPADFEFDNNKPLVMLPKLPFAEQQIAPRVLTRENVFIIHSMMQDVIHRGTAFLPLQKSKSPLLKRHDLAGKTGTTNEAKDAWFSGYNGDYVATAWVGYRNYKRGLGNNEFGGKAALPIWQGFMEVALKGKPENDLKQPPGLVTAKIDPATGLLAPAGMKGAIFEIFRQRYMPTKFATPELVDPFNDEKSINEETIF